MITTYKNKRNEHKYIDVKHYKDGHYLWRQRIVFDNGVENHIGTPKGGFRRVSLRWIHEVLDSDYQIVA